MPIVTKNKRILVQSAEFILLIFSVGIITNGIFTYRNFYQLSISLIKTDSDFIKTSARDILQKYSALPWLLDYWEENYKKLDTSLEVVKKYNEIPREFLLNRMNITSEQAASLSPEDQKLFAEFCYKEIAKDFNTLREAGNWHSLFVTRLLSDKDSFTFFYADKNYQDSSLGHIHSFNIEKHPLVTRMYATGKDPDEFEVIKVKDYYLSPKTEDFFYNYSLVKEKNKSLCHLAVCFLGTDIRKTIFNEVLVIAGVSINVFVFLGFIIILGIYFYILKPLLKIQKNVKDYTINKDHALAVSRLSQIHSQNEAGRLADDLSSLITELEHYTNEAAALSAEKAKIDSELSLAATIQDSALSKDFPDVKEFKLFASMDIFGN